MHQAACVPSTCMLHAVDKLSLRLLNIDLNECHLAGAVHGDEVSAHLDAQCGRGCSVHLRARDLVAVPIVFGPSVGAC